MKKLLIIIVLIGIWNYSNGQSSYFPVEKGMSWTYAYGAEIYGGTPYEDYTCDVTILDSNEVFDGKEYYISEASMGSGEGDNTEIRTYFRIGNDGSLISKVDEKTEEFVSMSKTPKVGDVYGSQQGGSTKVLDLDATIKTPTTTYTDCLLMEISDDQTTTRVYYQKNIGMVATTLVAEGSEKLFIYLVSE